MISNLVIYDMIIAAKRLRLKVETKNCKVAD